MTSSSSPFRVLIVGGGVAALEAGLALRELAADRIDITFLAPQPEFVYRPMTVVEPFGQPLARRYPIESIVRDIGADLVRDSFKWLEGSDSLIGTQEGRRLAYDALLLAFGARLHPRFKHVVTVDDRRIDEQLHGLIQDVEGGYVRSLAFIAPSRMPWPLPIYELALMTARRAYDVGAQLSITIATPEDSPLAIFGGAVTDAVRGLLETNSVSIITSAHCEVLEPRRVSIHPGPRTLEVDRIVALPELAGPETPGVPKDTEGGFISVDLFGRVSGLERVFAAGDATAFPIKHGGIAAQQADAAATAIAALAGASVEPEPFHPRIHGMLLGADRPLYLSAYVTGGHGTDSQVSDSPTWSPPTKIVARYLGPYLDSRDQQVDG